MQLPDKLTYGEAYYPAMKITDPEKAAEYLEALIEHSMRVHGQTREEAENIQKSNLGYYSGYYDHETMVRVQNLFDCAHPILGKAEPGKPISSETAFEAGKQWASKS